MVEKLFSNFLPAVASDIAQQWDNLFIFLVAVSIIFCFIVLVPIVWFIIKYREKDKPRKVGNITHNSKLELLWIVIPTIIVLIIFAWGWQVYEKMANPPEGAIEIRVTAHSWRWDFEYADGQKITDVLYVPEKMPIKLIMTSADVLHGFFLPDFRIKSDVVPGRYTSIWFQSKETGIHEVFCTEYCGMDHSRMRATVHVVTGEKYRKWLEDNKNKGPTERPKGLTSVEWGKQLLVEKGCNACHSLDGKPGVGPSYKGIWGKYHEYYEGKDEKNIKTVKVDENYIRESIEYPKKKIVKGYQPVMPSFKGIVDENEINAITDFIKSLK